MGTFRVARRVAVVMLAFLAVSLCAEVSIAAELKVGAGQVYVSIGDAMTVAVPGDVVKVLPGTYQEAVVFKQGVTIEGVSQKDVVILGPVVMASRTMLKGVSIRLGKLDKYAVSGSGLTDVKIADVDIKCGEYGSLTERLVSFSTSWRILLYNSVLDGTSANCAVFEKGCRNITLMRSAFYSRSDYCTEAKSPVVIRDSSLIKVFNSTFYKDRSYSPVWRGQPILVCENIRVAQVINNIFYAVVDNNPWQYGCNGLWFDNAVSANIDYNIFYQTGLFGVIPLVSQHHLNGYGIRFSYAIQADPFAAVPLKPTVDRGSPAFPLDPDFTRSDIGREITIQYDRIINKET